MLKKLILIIIVCSSIPAGFSQSTFYGDPLRDVTIVGACAVGGAVLGLSTLPFTEEPGDHLKNILVGGAIGLIFGVAIVAYSQATTTSEMEGFHMMPMPSTNIQIAKKDFSSLPDQNHDLNLVNLNYTFRF
jgi:hypothetical protein